MNNSLSDGTHVDSTSTLIKIKDLKRRATDCLSSIAGTPSSSSKRERIENENRRVYCSLVMSYDVKDWKHTDISPRELAIHGWRQKNERTVRCDSCKKIICTDMPNISENVEVYRKCLSSIRKQMVESHELTCPRRSVTLRLLRFESAQEVINDTRKRLLSYTIPLNLEVPNDISIPVHMFPNYSKEAVFSALLNWEIRLDSKFMRKRAFACCDLCTRKVLINSTAPFQPVIAHMKWCPILDLDSSFIPLWRAHISLLTEEKAVQMSMDSSKLTVDKVKSLIRRSLSSVSIAAISN